MGGVVRRHLAHERLVHGELRRALGCRLGRARSAAHHHAGDVRPGGGLDRIRDIALEPGAMLYPNNLRDIGSVAPRGGFTWNVGGNGNLVIRGGSGLYYSIPDSNTTFSIQSFNGERILVNSFPNDGRPGFIAGSDARRARRTTILSGRVPAAGAGPARDRARLPDAVDLAEHRRLPEADRQPARASKPTSRTGRATTSPASAIRTCSSIPRPATTATRRRAGPIRSTGRSSGSNRTAAPTTRRSRARSTAATPTTGRRR